MDDYGDVDRELQAKAMKILKVLANMPKPQDVAADFYQKDPRLTKLIGDARDFVTYGASGYTW